MVLIKRKASALTFITIFLLSTVAWACLVNLAHANFWYIKEVPPPKGTEPPAISILSPKNNSVYTMNSFSLVLNVSTAKSWKYQYAGDTGPWEHLMEVNYTLDWLEGSVSVYSQEQTGTWQSDFFYDITLSQVPDGKHEINVSAIASGSFTNGKAVPELTEYFYNISGFATVSFTVDTSPPSISILSLKNETYLDPDVPLDFTVNELVSQITYSLDGQENITINGNTILTSLPLGEHSLIVYARDVAGNIGVSETVYFSIEVPQPEPQPSEPLLITWIVAATAVVVAVGVVLVIYFTKIRRTTKKAEQQQDSYSARISILVSKNRGLNDNCPIFWSMREFRSSA